METVNYGRNKFYDTSPRSHLVALVPDMFRNFYLLKNDKDGYNPETTEAREKNKHRLGILGILENKCMFDIIENP